jgi:hypothetical protein
MSRFIYKNRGRISILWLASHSKEAKPYQVLDTRRFLELAGIKP